MPNELRSPSDHLPLSALEFNLKDDHLLFLNFLFVVGAFLFLCRIGFSGLRCYFHVLRLWHLSLSRAFINLFIILLWPFANSSFMSPTNHSTQPIHYSIQLILQSEHYQHFVSKHFVTHLVSFHSVQSFLCLWF